MSTVWARWDEAISRSEADPREVLGLAATYHRYLSAVEEVAVRACRSQGASWQDIAKAVGTTRQSVWEKWRHVEHLAELAGHHLGREIYELQSLAQEEFARTRASKERP